jgi:hypothetical protein
MIDRKRWLLPGCLFAALLFLLPAAAPAQPVGVFTKVEGVVDVLHPAAAKAAAVKAGDAVAMGDAIRTKRNSRAEIQFKDETVIQLAPETRITIDEYSFGGGAERERGLLSLVRGKVRAIVSKLRASVMPVGDTASGFTIKTPTAIAGVKGTDFIIYYERGFSGVLFLEGSGFVMSPDRPDRRVAIRYGQATFVRGPGAAPSRPVPVTGAFIAPHVRHTSIGRGPAKGPGSAVLHADILSPNMTAGVLANAAAENGGPGRSRLGGLDADTTVVPPSIPISESHPELITTRVKVNAVIP